MNLMTLQRYKNELIVLLALLFALSAFFYKLSQNSYVKENRTEISKKISEINTILTLKEQWGGKGLGSKVATLKTVVKSSKVQSFNKKSKKLIASYKELTGSELTKLTNKLINLPVQITNLNVQQRSKNKYTMEFTCKW